MFFICLYLKCVLERRQVAILLIAKPFSCLKFPIKIDLKKREKQCLLGKVPI